MKHPKIQGLKMSKVVICFAALVTVFIMMPDKAYAGYNDLPTYLPEMVDPADTGGQYINLAMGGNDPGSGYGADFLSNQLIVYARDSGPQQVRFGIVNRNMGAPACSGYAIDYTVWRIDSNGLEQGIGGLGSVVIGNCTIGPGYGNNNQAYVIDIAPGVLQLSSRLEDEGSYKAKLELRIVSTDGQPVHSATFRPNIDSSRGRLGYARGSNYSVYPSLNQSFENTLSMRFRQPCNVTENNKRLLWKDDDYVDPSPNPPGSPSGDNNDGNGTQSQWDSPRARVYEYLNLSRTGRNGNQRGTIYGNAGWGGTTVDLSPSYAYELLLESVDGGNGIMFHQPYDSGDFYFKCINFSVDSLVSSAADPWVELGASVSFTHTVNSSSSSGDNPIFTGRNANLNYDPNNPNALPGGSYDSLNRPGAVPLGSYTVADNELGTKTVGSAANLLSQQYCQRYSIAPRTVLNNVPTDPGPYVGAFACSTVVGGKTSAQAHRPGGGDELAENGDSVQFAPGLNTQNYTTSGGWQGYTIDCSWKLTRQPPAAGKVDIAGAGNSGSCDGTITANGPTNFAATTFVVPNTAEYPIGTKVCIEVTIHSASSRSRGVVNNAFIGNATAPSCYTVSAKPIVRTYVGDVIAGGRFGQNGTAGEGKINANTKSGFLYAGSGVEFAAIAANQITGFSSATMRTLGGSSPLPGTGLTFSNNSPTSLGSYFSSNSREVKDWFVGTMEGTTRDAPQTTPGPSINNAGFAAYADGGQTYFAPSANKTLTISAISNFTQSHTVYVDGDVIITGNIVANEASIVTGGGDVGSIPYFTVIAKGNIYISKDVTRLDGLYIAQPKDVSGGKNNDKDSGIIYTCKDPTDGASYSTANLYYSCDSKLTINGAFVSQKTKFLRTNGTLAQIAKTEDAVDPIGTPGINSGGWSWLGTTPDLNAAGCNDAGVKKVQLKVEHDLNWSNGDNYFCYKSDYELHFVDGDKLGAPASILSSLAANCASFNNTDANTGDVHSSVWSKAYLCAFTPPVVPLVSTPVDVGFEVLYGSTACSPGKEGVGIRESEWNPPGSESNRNPWGPGKVLLCYFPDRITTPGIPEKYEQLKFGDGKIAEAFRLSPEFYLGNPAFKPRSDRSDGNGEYDSILTLPPIL